MGNFGILFFDALISHPVYCEFQWASRKPVVCMVFVDITDNNSVVIVYSIEVLIDFVEFYVNRKNIAWYTNS